MSLEDIPGNYGVVDDRFLQDAYAVLANLGDLMDPDNSCGNEGLGKKVHYMLYTYFPQTENKKDRECKKIMTIPNIFYESSTGKKNVNDYTSKIDSKQLDNLCYELLSRYEKLNEKYNKAPNKEELKHGKEKVTISDEEYESAKEMYKETLKDEK